MSVRSSKSSSASSNGDESQHEQNSDEESGERSASRSTTSSQSSSYSGSLFTDKESDDDVDDEVEEEENEGNGSLTAEGETKTVNKQPQRGLKFTDDERLQLEMQNAYRRSNRKRAPVIRTEMNYTRRKKQKKGEFESNSDLSEFDYISRHQAGKKCKFGETWSSDDNSDVSIRPKRFTKSKSKGSINYQEPSSDEDIDADDVAVWKYEYETDPNIPEPETIEKVINHRIGYHGATGSATTCYNVEEKGDPNVPKDGSSQMLEQHFLIKWVGWSHIHNTWESEESLIAAKVKGMKKIDNYKRRLLEFEEIKKTAEKDDIEFLLCAQEMDNQLHEKHKLVERIIAHQISREKNDENGIEYYVKWLGLPYAESTWEAEHLISHRFHNKIEAYNLRLNNENLPDKHSKALIERPNFQYMSEIPEFLYRDGQTDQVRDYQLEGINFMVQAWTIRNGCILADEMGLGKTIQSIGFLSTLYHKYRVYGPFLVVVQLSTMAAWLQEFETWASVLNVVSYIGDANSRDVIRQYEIFVQGTKRLKIHVLITTYEILIRDKAFLGSFDWAVLIADEAHRLKNNDSIMYSCLHRFSTNHRLLITGTPLQNSLKELWALLHFIMPQKFHSWEDFEKDYPVTERDICEKLRSHIKQFVFRRTKKEVEKSLPAKVEQILRVDMTSQQKEYYKYILTRNYEELTKGVKGSRIGFSNIMMELKKCCNHASLVRPYVQCEITPEARLKQILKSSGKLILLDKLLCRLKEKRHRVLIFSQMVMMLDILQEYLQLRRFPSQRLDGSMRSELRKAALDHFNAEGSMDFCFLLSTRAGGLGINLATADTVIIFDSDWNPQNDLQAMSRAHRIGQTKQVNIYRLITKASIEERIVERAKAKLVLDHLVIQLMDKSGRTVVSKNKPSAGALPFDKHEANEILKFSAQKIFSCKDDEEQDLEVDIDDILERAETNECENHSALSDLLNSFKFSNFTFNEETDVQISRANNVSKNWDEIIPLEAREKLAEEERLQAEFQLAERRNRAKVNIGLDNSGDETLKKGKKDEFRDSENEDSDEDRPRRSKQKLFYGFNETEIRKFAKSFRKFANPLSRLEAIAQDAELEEHGNDDLIQLGKELLEGCINAQQQYEKQSKTIEKKQAEEGKRKQDRGAVFKLGTTDIYVRPILKMHADLKPLSDLVVSTNDLNSLELPFNMKPPKGWSVEWGMDDDVALLRGIYRYGMGSWEAIKLDPEYSFAEKVLLKDKSKKPQAKHLQARAEYLLKHLAGLAKLQLKKNKLHNKLRSKKEKLGRKVHSQKLMKLRPPESKGHMKDEKDIKARFEKLQINEKYEGELKVRSGKIFKECIQMMRPVREKMKCLFLSQRDSTDSVKCLLKIGHHIEGLLKKFSGDTDSELEAWNSRLWIFLALFDNSSIFDHSANQLFSCYRNAAKQCRADKEQHHKSHHESRHSSGQHHHRHRYKNDSDDLNQRSSEMQKISNANESHSNNPSRHPSESLDYQFKRSCSETERRQGQSSVLHRRRSRSPYRIEKWHLDRRNNIYGGQNFFHRQADRQYNNQIQYDRNNRSSRGYVDNRGYNGRGRFGQFDHRNRERIWSNMNNQSWIRDDRESYDSQPHPHINRNCGEEYGNKRSSNLYGDRISSGMLSEPSTSYSNRSSFEFPREMTISQNDRSNPRFSHRLSFYCDKDNSAFAHSNDRHDFVHADESSFPPHHFSSSSYGGSKPIVSDQFTRIRPPPVPPNLNSLGRESTNNSWQR